MTYQFYSQFFLKHCLELTPDTEVATTDQILPLVKNELGLAFLPEKIAEEAIARHEIVQIALQDPVPERQICMVYDVEHSLNAPTRQLKNLILGGNAEPEKSVDIRVYKK